MKEALLSRAKVTGAPSAKGRATKMFLHVCHKKEFHDNVNRQVNGKSCDAFAMSEEYLGRLRVQTNQLKGTP